MWLLEKFYITYVAHIVFPLKSSGVCEKRNTWRIVDVSWSHQGGYEDPWERVSQGLNVSPQGWAWEAPARAAVELEEQDFPGGTVGRNAPTNAGDRGSIPGPGRFHMPWGN